jgi:RNA polymerase sigma-70 factor (ECF subfamily)
MHHLSDAALVRLAQDGQVEAVGQLYDRHQERIYRYVRARIYDNQSAQDLTGEVFLKMVANIQRYQERGAPFSAWLYRIAHNHLINHNHQDRNDRLVPVEQAEYVPLMGNNPAVVVEKQQLEQELLLALERIDPLQREVVVLRFLVGLSLQETATTLDKSVAAIKSTQHRGLKALRANMK